MLFPLALAVLHGRVGLCYSTRCVLGLYLISGGRLSDKIDYGTRDAFNPALLAEVEPETIRIF